MKLNLFDYNLPKEMIATEPANPRDAARLFVYNRLNKKSIHERFYNIGKFFQKGDVLVLNDTKVIPARLIGRRIMSSLETLASRSSKSEVGGRKFKILLLERKSPNVWTCLIDGKGRKEGIKFLFSVIASEAKQSHEIRDRHALRARDDKNVLCGEVIKRVGGGIWEIKFSASGKKLDKMIFKLGQMPLPPYIKQDGYKKENKDWYQTVYAKYAGSVAAPTAGLHFASRLLKQLKKQGIKIEYVTLHVGLGTFLPVKAENIEEHKMHEELAIITPSVARRLNTAKKEGRRIIACGTTAARTLESFATPFVIPDPERQRGKYSSFDHEQFDCHELTAEWLTAEWGIQYIIKPGKKRTDIFIYPPYRPKFFDALITNFHLPKSTLMMLVSAFLSPGDKKGIKILQNLYAEAVRKKYRFYSYGDAMLVK